MFHTATCSPGVISANRISEASIPMLPTWFKSAAVTTARCIFALQMVRNFMVCPRSFVTYRSPCVPYLHVGHTLCERHPRLPSGVRHAHREMPLCDVSPGRDVHVQVDFRRSSMTWPTPSSRRQCNLLTTFSESIRCVSLQWLARDASVVWLHAFDCLA